jgi:hypothetical protein
MEAANTTDCARSGRCKVAFRLGVPPSPGWFTISLQSPLPAMRPMLSIDGTTQTRLFGDTNPAGPEIFLDGSRLTQGNGVVFESAEVVSLAIGNFPNAGILITRPPVAASEVIVAKVPREIHACYIGVAPDGETAAPNERGIVVVADTIASSPFIITGNVISANRRTGIYLLGSPVEVLNNVIGLDAQHRKPLGNGASGIYAASSSFFLNIRFASHYAYVSGNYITSATYDSAANKTIIDTTHPPDFGIHSGRLAPYYFYYASDAPHPSGYGDGQYFLGMTQGANHLAVDGNLRGKWISVYVTQHKIDCCFDNGSTGSQNTATLTGEFSRAVQVK